MINSVQQEIMAAFGTLPVPAADQLLGPSRGDEAGEQLIQQALAGQRWQALGAAYLQERWPYFCYLSNAGFRYYLPALLMNCLDNFTPENKLLHSTVYFLTPSYWSLYFRGADEVSEYQTSLFTEAQYKAVCSFLGLVFDQQPYLKMLAAKALKWGWNRYEHTALVRCRDFYRDLYHYQYPPSSDPTVASLVAQIRAAFANTPYPGDDQLCGSSQGDEPAEYALEFRDLNWQTIHPDFLAYHYAALSFFTEAGFRYFLPAFLIAEVMGTDSNANPVFHLTHGLVPDKTQQIREQLMASGALPEDVVQQMRQNEERATYDWQQIALDKFSHFNGEERKAIVAYLQYAADEYSMDDINRALESYWLKPPP